MKTLLRLIVASAAFISLSAHAGVILQGHIDGGALQVNFFEPIGQSFSAEDANINFAFYYAPINLGSPVDTLQLRLLDGEGLDGDQLASVVFTMPIGYRGFYDVDLSSASLTVGQRYTAVLSIPGSSPYWGASFSGTNPYGAGRAFFSGDWADSDYDMTFRVTPSAQQVPEPASIAMLGLGLAALGVIRRKKGQRRAS